MAVSKLAPQTDQEWQDEAFSRQFVLDKLQHYRALRAEHLRGCNTPSWEEINRSLNTWLDELCGLAEIRWTPKTKKEKRLMGWRN